MEDSSAEGLRHGRLVAAPTSAYFWPAQGARQEVGSAAQLVEVLQQRRGGGTGHLSVAHALDDDQPLIVHPRRWKEMADRGVGPGCRQRGVQVCRVGHRLVEDRRERRPVEGHDVKSVRARGVALVDGEPDRGCGGGGGAADRQRRRARTRDDRRSGWDPGTTDRRPVGVAGDRGNGGDLGAARRRGGRDVDADAHSTAAAGAGVDRRVLARSTVDHRVVAGGPRLRGDSLREVADDAPVLTVGLRGGLPPRLPHREPGDADDAERAAVKIALLPARQLRALVWDEAVPRPPRPTGAVRERPPGRERPADLAQHVVEGGKAVRGERRRFL